MNPGLLFWTAALVDLGVVCLVAILGVRCARRGEIARHRRAMKTASWLVVAFLLCYGLKVWLIGREDMSLWSQLDLWVLRIHELFVMIMLVAGAVAWSQARKLRGTRIVTRVASDPEPAPGTVRMHRRSGRVAVVSAVLGFAMAIGVLAGMFQRAAT
jgi:uncharacterized membrane protein YozB (DUF420 family)